MPNTINEQPAPADSVLEGGDDVAQQSNEDDAPSVRIPEAVSHSHDDPAWDNVSLDTPAGYSDEDGCNSVMCRICHDDDQDEPLVSPCKCSGSMGFVHVSCLEHWLNEQNVDLCEICFQRFPMAAQPSIALRFYHWISQREARLQRALLHDLLVWAMLTTGAVIVFVLILQVAFSEASQGDSFIWAFLLVVLVLISCTILGCGAATFVRLRILWNLFTAWKRAHPLRRIMTVSSTAAGTPGRTGRIDAWAAVVRATSAWRRRR
ncbi:hypothetical protein HPB50_025185 [Hyalomma asiaticum]|uniref:Uncharacterized protein n=1 Tax=Hyalomma asiaticum TaxID=266040 RepID=A0ACB7TRA9_HYAAI|nr:hypothetical protein HPB50_025185 [Hyalomma asiaticum]